MLANGLCFLIFFLIKLVNIKDQLSRFRDNSVLAWLEFLAGDERRCADEILRRQKPGRQIVQGRSFLSLEKDRLGGLASEIRRNGPVLRHFSLPTQTSVCHPIGVASEKCMALTNWQSKLKRRKILG